MIRYRCFKACGASARHGRMFCKISIAKGPAGVWNLGTLYFSVQGSRKPCPDMWAERGGLLFPQSSSKSLFGVTIRSERCRKADDPQDVAPSPRQRTKFLAENVLGSTLMIPHVRKCKQPETTIKHIAGYHRSCTI